MAADYKRLILIIYSLPSTPALRPPTGIQKGSDLEISSLKARASDTSVINVSRCGTPRAEGKGDAAAPLCTNNGTKRAH